jgi:dihydroneopterin aldolase
MTHLIEVSGIKVYCYHGCMEEEALIGGHYIVDVEIKTNFSNSFKSDELQDTVDYVAINSIVKEEMAIRSKLIEHVGYRIIQRLKVEVSGIIEAKIKVIKLSPPIDGDVHHVAIVIHEVF